MQGDRRREINRARVVGGHPSGKGHDVRFAAGVYVTLVSPRLDGVDTVLGLIEAQQGCKLIFVDPHVPARGQPVTGRFSHSRHDCPDVHRRRLIGEIVVLESAAPVVDRHDEVTIGGAGISLGAGDPAGEVARGKKFPRVAKWCVVVHPRIELVVPYSAVDQIEIHAVPSPARRGGAAPFRVFGVAVHRHVIVAVDCEAHSGDSVTYMQ